MHADAIKVGYQNHINNLKNGNQLEMLYRNQCLALGHGNKISGFSDPPASIFLLTNLFMSRSIKGQHARNLLIA